MRTEEEIQERIETYEDNLRLIRNEEGRRNAEYMISELKWVLGGDGK